MASVMLPANITPVDRQAAMVLRGCSKEDREWLEWVDKKVKGINGGGSQSPLDEGRSKSMPEWYSSVEQAMRGLVEKIVGHEVNGLSLSVKQENVKQSGSKTWVRMVAVRGKYQGVAKTIRIPEEDFNESVRTGRGAMAMASRIAQIVVFINQPKPVAPSMASSAPRVESAG